MSMKGKTLVGLDVHAAQTHAAVLDTLTGELRVKRLVCPPLEGVPFLQGVGAGVRGGEAPGAVLDPLAGGLRVKRLVCPPLEVVPFLEGLGPGVRAVYEAGPTGFGLVRVARERGIDLEVVAPGLDPEGVG